LSIRRATILDLEHILDLTNRFNDEYFDIELDQDKTEETLVELILNGVVLVSDTGFIGGLVVPDIFRNWTYLQELGWYAKDASGYRLLLKFIAVGRELGVDEVRMCTLVNSNPAAESILRRTGFSPIEQSHRLIIKE